MSRPSPRLLKLHYSAVGSHGSRADARILAYNTGHGVHLSHWDTLTNMPSLPHKEPQDVVRSLPRRFDDDDSGWHHARDVPLCLR